MKYKIEGKMIIEKYCQNEAYGEYDYPLNKPTTIKIERKYHIGHIKKDGGCRIIDDEWVASFPIGNENSNVYPNEDRIFESDFDDLIEKIEEKLDEIISEEE